MKILVADEPLLKFHTGTHIDIREGLRVFGTFDKGQQNVPNPINVGLVGTAETIAGVSDWIERTSKGVKSEEKKLVELRPSFPGVTEEIFGTQINASSSFRRSISKSELSSALNSKTALYDIVQLFFDHARDLASRGNIHVIVIAPPAEVFLLAKSAPLDVDAEFDESQDQREIPYRKNFHDLFKARALELASPCQVIRPDTYGGGSTKKDDTRKVSLQDPATRAWNFHLALYYKAGGIPWRLSRSSSELTTCYVGTSFYKSADGQRLLTSVAQIFDERGEGLIVQGGAAQVDKSDRSPHLTADDARKLLANGLATYKREHRTLPARVVLHKTSYFNDQEIEGFRAAAVEHHIDLLDLISIRRSNLRLFRTAVPPTIRGTILILDEQSGLVYLKGTVPYFRVYPGMYVPRAIEFRRDYGEGLVEDLAKELLGLSKLNFNNTQFDSGDPITIRAARRVGDILKHVPAQSPVQSRFRYFT